MMTFYEQQITEIRNRVFQKNYLYGRMTLAKNFIHTHFARNISVEEMASAACFSKYHFLRLFKSIYYCTPHEYLTLVRIEKAKQLLRADKTIADVCFSIGFISISSFKSLFKRHTCHSPLSYKKEFEKNKSRSQHAVSPFVFYYKKQFSSQAHS